MKWLAIINPFSGRTKTPPQTRKILNALQQIEVTYEFTRYSGHARQLARESVGFDGIAVIGGDGTLFEVLNGMDRRRQHLAVIPAGTGNSLVRDLHITNAFQGIDLIRQHHTINIDLLHVCFSTTDNTQHDYDVASTIGIGYPANATCFGNRHFKPFGRFCYPLAATCETLRNKQLSARLSYNGNDGRRKSLTGLLLNNTQHAGNFAAFPDASLEDGKCDVMEMQVGCLKQNLHNLSVLSKTYWYCPVNIRRTPSITIEVDPPQHLMLDGEIFSNVRHVEIQVMPHALTCYKAEA